MWVPAGLFFLPWYRHYRFYGLVPRRLVSSIFQFDRHGVAWPCLPRSWDPPAFWLRQRFSLQDCRLCALFQLWQFCTFAFHFTLTATSLANDFYLFIFFFFDTRPVAFAPVTMFHWWVSVLLVCSLPHYHVHFYGTSRRPHQRRDSC